jgi:hypothetical protein
MDPGHQAGRVTMGDEALITLEEEKEEGGLQIGVLSLY